MDDKPLPIPFVPAPFPEHRPTYDTLKNRAEELEKCLGHTAQLAAALEETICKFNELLAGIDEGYCETDLAGKITFINEAFGAIMGMSRKELVSTQLMDVFISEDAHKLDQAFNLVNHSDRPIRLKKLSFLRLIRQRNPIDLLIALQRNPSDRHPTGFRLIAKDVAGTIQTDENCEDSKMREEDADREMERMIERANKMAVEAEMARIELHQIFNTSADGIWVVGEDFTVQRINGTLLKWLEANEQEAVGRKCYELFAGSICRGPKCPMTRMMDGLQRIECDTERKSAEGLCAPFILTATPFLDLGGERVGIVESFKDIAERKHAETALWQANRELERIASVDGLTKVANRRHFDIRYALEWRRMLREKQPLSVLMCDVDCFKLYNDHYGHQLGDDCLCKVAAALDATAKRPADLVARYGGEEFVVLLPNTPCDGALYVATRMLDSVRKLQISHEKSPVVPHVTLSIGISCLTPKSNIDPAGLIQKADSALYAAKKSGRNQAVLKNSDPSRSASGH